MKLLVTRPLPEPVLERLRGAHEVVLRGEDRPMSEAEAAAALAAYDAILPTLGDDFAAGAFAGEIRTRLLANFGVGYNHIDIAAARARGVAVTNTPGVLTDATADIAMTLLLASARRAGEGERLLRRGGWTGFHPTAFLGTEVSGKTLGIVGMGAMRGLAWRWSISTGRRSVCLSGRGGWKRWKSWGAGWISWWSRCPAARRRII